MQIQFLRLVTGEDIISQVDNTDPNRTILVDPLKLLYVMDRSTGKVVISMTQWIYTHVVDKQNFTIEKNQILVTGEPEKDLIGYYTDCLEHFKTPEKPSPDEPTSEAEALKMLEDILGDMFHGGKKTLH